MQILAVLAPNEFITLAMEKQSWMESSFTRCCAQILHQASHSAGYFNKRLDSQQSGRKLVITIYNDFEEEDLKREQTKRMPRRGQQSRLRRKQRRALEKSSGCTIMEDDGLNTETSANGDKNDEESGIVKKGTPTKELLDLKRKLESNIT